MKSSKQQMQSRGFVSDNEIIKYLNLSEDEAVKLLYDNDPYKRTMGIKLISKQKKEKYIPLFCELLQKEKKLYTKVELCNSLAGYGALAIPYLISLLGAIGNNQHKEIKAADLNKKSYPLPRDIAGRILIRIGPVVFPQLKNILLENKDKKQIYEVIDVIGHITWNYQDYRMEEDILAFFDKNIEDEFIIWKITRSLQSFKSDRVKNMLKEIIKKQKNKIIIE